MRVWVWERVTGVEKALVLPLCQDQQGVNVNQCLIKEAKNGYLIIIIHFFSVSVLFISHCYKKDPKSVKHIFFFKFVCLLRDSIHIELQLVRSKFMIVSCFNTFLMDIGFYITIFEQQVFTSVCLYKILLLGRSEAELCRTSTFDSKKIQSKWL